MTHDQLCRRALRWLRGHRRCNPVFANCASCQEIPDAIGWSSCFKWRGSHVVECKTSWNDFVRDRHKGEMRMGEYRLFMCEPHVATAEDVTYYYPDHGLVYVEGGRVKYAREAPRRENPNFRDEVRFLRYAIINRKFDHVRFGVSPPVIQEAVA